MSVGCFLTEAFSHILLTDIYKFDAGFLENEEKYKEIKAEILGEGSDDESESESGDSDSGSEGGAGKLCLKLRPIGRILTSTAQWPTNQAFRT